tara:strand:- start:5872 stop:7212 length:1341 start_codon:yes stop_codon:yes gene_type:complete
MSLPDTIVAPASAPFKGAVGVVRISGEGVPAIAQAILGNIPEPRMATLSKFKDKQEAVIDTGLALYFPGPNSFTGEDVLELQCHGGVVVVNMLLGRALELGARMARPGEFSERAFLNDKIDLLQAEAIADLINASTQSAVKSANRSLSGEFSQKINLMQTHLNEIRIFVEAAIDFVDEEIDFLSDGRILDKIKKAHADVVEILQSARTGQLLQEGAQIAIAGRPNAGKSSLLNLLAQQDVAIVTDIPGTTRDTLTEIIEIEGVPYHFTDTAGIRKDAGAIEQEGIKRAKIKFTDADFILLMVDATEAQLFTDVERALLKEYKNKICILVNKVDLLGKLPCVDGASAQSIFFSAKDKTGLADLFGMLKQRFNMQTEGVFSARKRHILALECAQKHMENAKNQLVEFDAPELVAEELKLSQEALSDITGKVTSDQLLGKIFSSFCIGK